MKTPETREVLKVIIPAVLLFLISMLIARALDSLPLKHVVIGSVLLLAITLGIVGLLLLFLRTSHQSEIDAIIASHQTAMVTAAASNREEFEFLSQQLTLIIQKMKYDWLLFDADIARIEARVKGKEIWIVSPNLDYDVHKQDFHGALQRNFAKGITYRFIVPESEQMSALVPMLMTRYKAHERQIKVVPIEENNFNLLALTHIDIYDPNSKEARVFLELPIEDRGYWIKLTQTAGTRMIGRFRKLMGEDGAM